MVEVVSISTDACGHTWSARMRQKEEPCGVDNVARFLRIGVQTAPPANGLVLQL